MKFRNLICAGLIALIPVCAHAEVTNITPSKNIGVYKQNEEVSFTVTKSNADNESFYVTAENVYGEAVTTDVVTANSENFNVGFGVMRSGWYRVRLYDMQYNEVPVFASFTVLPTVETPADNSPFSGMLVGLYGVSDERRADVSEALNKTGINYVRDSALWCDDDYDFAVLEPNISALYNSGNKQLLTVDVQNDRLSTFGGYNGDLYKVFNMHKNLSAKFGDKVGAWDIINEPDINGKLTADIFSSYYKAAALGIEAAGKGNDVSFGGLCSPSTEFAECMLQNGVMNYATFFNAHSHKTSTGNLYNDFPGSLVAKSKRFSALYGDNQPLWVTEAGLRMDVDENELPDSKTLNEQTKYLTTSFCESVGKYGTNNHFWFLMRHYIENDREFGMASSNYMTYPGYFAFANLAYNLGEATPIGEYSDGGDTVGYFFDTGDGDAAVFWKKSKGTSYVQLECDDPIVVCDVLGGTEVRYVMNKTGKVSFAVTAEPVIVKFGGKCPHSNYGKRTFPEYKKQARTAGDYVVLQQVWNSDNYENGLRVLEAGKTYQITCKVYNFGDSAVSGTIDILADGNIEIVSRPQASDYSLNAYSSAATNKVCEFTYTVKVKDGTPYGTTGCVKFSTDGISPSVAGYTVDNKVEYDSSTVKAISGAYIKRSWYYIDTTGSANVSVSGNSVTFSASFNGGDPFMYAFIRATVPKGAEGIVFDRTMKDIADGGVSQVFVSTDSGTYLAKAGDFSVGTASFAIPWAKFKKYGSTTEPLDPTKINLIKLGFNSNSDKKVTYTITNFGTYGTSYGKAPEETVKITGIENGKTYVKGKVPDICIECDNETADVYVNFEKKASIKSGESLSLFDLDSGATSIIAAVTDEFGKITYKEINIYVREYNDYSGIAVFY